MADTRILRLLITEECNRNCTGCCNKDWSLQNLPVVSIFHGFNQVLLTGGEPMLRPDLLEYYIGFIRKDTIAPIYMYTAKTDNIDDLLYILQLIDGITITLHEQKDLANFISFYNTLIKFPHLRNKSYRLNVFQEVNLGEFYPCGWTIKENISWQKDCPLPENEVFMRINSNVRT